MSKGFRRRTRKLLTKKGNSGFSDRFLLLSKMKEGDKVVIILNPKYSESMPHRRYHGKVGIIKGKRGNAFKIMVTKGDKKIMLIVPFEHLRPFEVVNKNA